MRSTVFRLLHITDYVCSRQGPTQNILIKHFKRMDSVTILNGSALTIAVATSITTSPSITDVPNLVPTEKHP